jgi:hypothetical protein
VTGSANGGSHVTGYTVYWKAQDDASYVVAGTTGQSTLQLQKAVSSPGTTYDFYVTATNDHGTSLASDFLSVQAADSPSTMAAPFKIYADTT